MFDMAENMNFWVRYSSSVLVCSSSSGSGKKVAMNPLAFSSFETALDADPSSCVPRFSVGTCIFPPSVGDPCHDPFPELSHIVIPTSSPLGLLHRPLLG